MMTRYSFVKEDRHAETHRMASDSESTVVPDQHHGVRSLLSCLEAEQLIDVHRIGEDLLRLSKAGFAAELAPNGGRFGKVTGGSVPPYLIPFGRSQHRPQGLGRSHEAVEERGPILVHPTRRFVEQKNPPRSGRVA